MRRNYNIALIAALFFFATFNSHAETTSKTTTPKQQKPVVTHNVQAGGYDNLNFGIDAINGFAEKLNREAASKSSPEGCIDTKITARNGEIISVGGSKK